MIPNKPPEDREVKTKEQILYQFDPNDEYPSYYHESNILDAMEEYAAQFKSAATTVVNPSGLQKDIIYWQNIKEVGYPEEHRVVEVWIEENEMSFMAIWRNSGLGFKWESKHYEVIENLDDIKFWRGVRLDSPDDTTPPPQPLGIEVKNTQVYNSPYPSEVMYKSDKNFMVRFRVLFERIAKGEYNINDAEDYLFESRTEVTKIKWGVKEKYPRQYDMWRNIIKRCYNPEYKDYKYYGARGIVLSKEFRHVFLNFLDYIMTLDGYDRWLKHPNCGLSMDRIDNNGDYERGNMRFADKSTQHKNKRSKKDMNTEKLEDLAKKYANHNSDGEGYAGYAEAYRAFKAGYAASQSSTSEEEKDLWNDLFDYYEDRKIGRGEFIKQQMDYYKISKR